MGFFEVDYLVDTGSGELYLGELNPRISGISPMTNVTAGAYADMPLFLFHLLEYLDLDYDVDIDEINERWSHEASVDVWSQLIMNETAEGVDLLTAAPRTGVYTIAPDGSADFRRHAYDWHGIVDESEAFYLRILAPGDFRYKGADLGAIVTRAAAGRRQHAGAALRPVDQRHPPPVRRDARGPAPAAAASPRVVQDGLTPPPAPRPKPGPSPAWPRPGLGPA